MWHLGSSVQDTYTWTVTLWQMYICAVVCAHPITTFSSTSRNNAYNTTDEWTSQKA